MLKYYYLTPFEQYVDNLLFSVGVNRPDQLKIDVFALKFDVWVHYLDMGSRAIERNGLKSIVIDSRLGPREQWEDFLHELCHLLRHAGNQICMKKSFREKQEAEAKLFTMYAGLPISMLRQIEWPKSNSDSEILELWTEKFGITFRLAADRLQQIKRRIHSSLFQNSFKLRDWNKTVFHQEMIW
ncbi:MAG: hypothetical protein BAA01_11820 [Bacillus thermozeamaize]|uniref:IrrE N-terminal-like domain-containing protein n=1 Tax=Bacillus thermozeamaize TaxID=230954 RepID=A0A1Y3PH25_9BACI|nr:MAG: hypothetical protein BAA01_11820 [Bacillus thermozeamaize]